MILAVSNVPLYVDYHTMRHDDPSCVVPYDLIEGRVEIEGKVQLFSENFLPWYEATGSTEVNWNSQTTVGLFCEACEEVAIVPHWAREFAPIKRLVRWLVDNVNDELAGWH